jgi:hypothetical protein
MLVVAVSPSSELSRCRRLFRALEEVFPVRFEPRGSDFDGAHAVILAGGNETSSTADRPAYVAAAAGAGQLAPEPREVATSASPLLDERLRRRALPDEHARISELEIDPGDAVLAMLDGRPVWTARVRDRVRHDFVSVNLEELGVDESLRDGLRSGRFLALLPLVEFLRRVSGYQRWSRPPLHATFVFDDPNLHRLSYGFLDFRRLARHAHEHGYHAAIATIPLDAWFVDPRAARLFREQSRYLSLLIHGNDHTYRELDSAADPIAPLAQAVRRTQALERRAGVPVSRVVVPPHGRYSDEILRAMSLFELEAMLAVCPPPWWYERPPEQRLVGCWWPADMSVAGFPILTRYGLAWPRRPNELLFWAYLDQPIVVYAHHEDVAGGLEPLAAEAEHIRGLAGEIVWSTAQDLARSAFATLLEGEVLRVKLFTRRARVPIPEEARMLRIEIETPYPGAEADAVIWDGDRLPLRPSGRGLVALAPMQYPGRGYADLVVARAPAFDPANLPLPRRSAAATLRRTIAEARDRMRPLVRRAGAETLLRRAELAYDRAMTGRHRRRVAR